MIRKVFGPVLFVTLVAPLAITAQEPELTANAGWVSQYYYRGILQKSSSASAGLDFAAGVFSAGTWAADVGDGAEVDLYAGFGVDLTDDISVSVGGTGYFYTGEFDDTYLEGNLGLGLGPFSFEYSLGSYRTSPAAADYSFLAVTLEQNGFFVTGAAFGADLWLKDVFDNGQYAEAGYGFSAADLDFVISGIFNDAALSAEFVCTPLCVPTNELTLVFGVSKTFSIDID